MYGEAAKKLIGHINDDRQGDLIPAYEYALIDQIKKENDELYAENLRTSQTGTARAEIQASSAEISQPTSENGTNEEKDSLDDIDLDKDVVGVSDNIDISEKEIMIMQVRHTAKLWNKRAIIAYHYARLKKLKKLRWDYGNNLPQEIVQNLTRDELEWFSKYNDNLFIYMNALNNGQGLDLTLYMKPPKRLNVKFKCLRDYGQFELNGEARLLKKDNLYYLPLKQCEKLVQQGVLEHIKD